MNVGNVRVLLVEDDPDDYFLTSELVAEMPGARIKLDWAKDFDSAVEAISNCDHDAYLLDYNLGQRDGIELLSAAIDGGCTGPLIMLTGAGDRDLALKALDAGAADYLVKGEFDAAVLERTIRYAIQQARNAAELEQKVRERTAELEQANTELKASEEFARTVLESTPDCIKVLDTEGNLVSLNTGGMCLLEIDDFSEFCGRSWETLWPQESRKRVVSSVTNAMSGVTDRFRAFSPTVKGTPKWWDVIVAPVRDGDGQIVRLVSVSRDVTAEKLDEMRAVMLARLGEIIRTNSDPDALLYAVSVAVGVYFGVRRCFFNEIDLENGLGTVRRDYCRFVESYTGQHNLSDFSPLTNAEMKKGKTVANADSKIDSRTAEIFQKIYEPRGERAYVAVPLMRGGRWVATLRVSDDKPRNWSDEEIRLLEGIGERSWLAVEKLRSEDDRRESESRLTHAMNAARLTYVEVELAEGVARTADNFNAVMGYPSPLEQIGDVSLGSRVLLEHVAPDDRANVKAALDGFKAGKSVGKIEYRVIGDDGIERWIESLWSIEAGPDGKPQKSFATNLDITSRKKAENSLRESEAFSSTVVDSLSSQVAVLDRGGSITRVNKAWREFAGANGGTTPTTEVGVNYLHVCSTALDRAVDQDIGVIRDGLKAVLQGKSSGFTIEYPCHSPTEQRWFLMSVVPLQDEGGGAVVSHLDITERRRAENALRESEKQLRTMADSIPQLAWMAEPDGYIFWYNQRWYEYTGTTPEQMEGWGWQSVHDPEILPKAMEGWTRAIVDGTLFETEFPLRGADGMFRWFLTRVNPLHDSDGNLVRWFGTNTDITDRREAEETLLRNMNELSRFNRAMVGRELRMIQLKKEVNDLCRVTGDEKRYTLDFEENTKDEGI